MWTAFGIEGEDISPQKRWEGKARFGRAEEERAVRTGAKEKGKWLKRYQMTILIGVV